MLKLFGQARFRHPSRIRKEDLTINTYRLHLKLYMDRVSSSSDMSRVEDPFLIESTPPRTEVSFGFTTSYLRRVPELQLLARRIVVAEHRRRYKDEIRKLKEQWQKACSDSSRPVPRPTIPPYEALDERSICKKAKRIVLHSLKKLWDDGEIILWDGLRHAIPEDDGWPSTHDVWRSRDAASSFMTTQSSNLTTTTIPEEADADMAVMTEPEDDEEAFVPLTLNMLADKVLQVMKNMKKAPLRDRRRYAVEGIDPANSWGKPQSPSEGEIVKWMGRDDLWSHLGEIHVIEALHHLEQQEASLFHREWEVGAFKKGDANNILAMRARRRAREPILRCLATAWPHHP